MSHEIAKTISGKDAMAYVGSTPWHGLGQELTADAPLDVWATESGLDFKLATANVEYTAPMFGGGKEKNTFFGKKVMYRTDSNLALGLVSDKYKIVQPIEVLEFFRDMVGNIAHLETAGVLRNGAHYWALAKMDGEFSMAGDKVEQYLLLASSADGSLATQARLTSVRGIKHEGLQPAVLVRREVHSQDRSPRQGWRWRSPRPMPGCSGFRPIICEPLHGSGSVFSIQKRSAKPTRRGSGRP
jgi:phage/plasmid-like protein (TIGR03299 family)